jgi:orotidine-5'-phosphate decarboxylase
MLCVGLDPDPARFPAAVGSSVFDFCMAIVDATADVVCAFKPQIAYFAATGAERDLERICAAIRDRYPSVLLVLDAKRGDIGSTAEQYAREAFDRYRAHAVTVNPYLGTDSVDPILRHPDGGVVVLCRTSNPGSGDFQSLMVDGEPLYAYRRRWLTSGTRSATAAWWWVPPTRPSSRPCGPSSVICRCWCPAWAHRAVT